MSSVEEFCFLSRNLTADLTSCEKESSGRQIQGSVTVSIIRIR